MSDSIYANVPSEVLVAAYHAPIDPTTGKKPSSGAKAAINRELGERGTPIPTSSGGGKVVGFLDAIAAQMAADASTDTDTDTDTDGS